MIYLEGIFFLHYSMKCSFEDVMSVAWLPSYVSMGINIATILCYLLMPVAMRCRVGAGNKKY
jgi:hypothetical protein